MKSGCFLGRKEEFLTEGTVERIFEKARSLARVNKKASVYTLRHSFTTHLLKDGTDLRFRQKLLGHSSAKTTDIYTHVTQKSLSNTHSALDKLSNLNFFYTTTMDREWYIRKLPRLKKQSKLPIVLSSKEIN